MRRTGGASPDLRGFARLALGHHTRAGSDERIAQGSDWFRIEFTVTNRQGEIAFAWDGCIEGRQDSTVRFAMSGGATASFLANRIGFRVLHPIDGCAGRDCTVVHTSGINESTRFPQLVSPHQTFLMFAPSPTRCFRA